MVSGRPWWFGTVLLTNRPVSMVAGGKQNVRRAKPGRFSILSTLVNLWGLCFPPMLLLLSGVKCIVGKVADLSPQAADSGVWRQVTFHLYANK